MRRHIPAFKNIIFILIICLAAFLRLWRISDVPPGVNRDEASIGYTAYSLLKTGNDEYGRRFPISFESFGDWKLPLYIYLDIPFVAAFGPTELAIRLPSALAGITAVILLYFLVHELFGKRNLALLASFTLAVSPWHLHLSRVESESNVAVMFVTAALLLFFKSLKPKAAQWLLPASAVLFSLTYYTYHGNHITTTLIMAGLLFIYRKSLPKGKILLISAALFILLTGFILSKTLVQADKTKISGISIFGDPAVIHERIEVPRSQSANPTGLLTRLRYNRVTYGVTTVAANYLNAFSPQFLFFRGGGNKAHNIEGMGNFYFIESIFLVLGVLYLLTSYKKRSSQFLLWWLLIAPAAASITKDAPHTNRMFAIFPLPAIIIALGALPLLLNKWNRSAVIAVYTLSILGYLFLYHTQFPVYETRNWGYAVKQITPKLTSTYASEHVVMPAPESSPYIFLLLYSRYDPAAYQREAMRYPLKSDEFVHDSE